ncbi:MAG: ABC transporter ATP-binding protein [Candidatus Micrarchaeaceae archaeon]
MNIIECKDLKMYYRQRGSYFNKKYVKAVDGVSFDIKEGEIFGLVGETGSGKTTIGRIMLGLIKPTSGLVDYKGVNIFSLRKREMRKVRTEIQMIFQDPYSALDPRFKIKEIIKEPLKLNRVEYDDELITRIMQDAGLTPVEDFKEKYPHQLSGGQRQRVLIARALVIDPKFLIADEPASMLDVSLKASVLNYLKRINSEQKKSMLVISHDIALVRYVSKEIAVLYHGKIFEKASSEEIISNPLHPYTRLLIESVPELGKELDDVMLPNNNKVRVDEKLGCSFYPRCQFATDLCRYQEPVLKEVSNNHYVACHLF